MTRYKTWEESLAELNGWMDVHGRLPTSGAPGEEEKKLAQWASVQRTRVRKGTLPESKVARLSALIGDPTGRPGQNLFRNELPAWVTAHGRLPKLTSNQARSAENLLAHKLFRLRKANRDGKAKLHHLELLLSIPGCLEGQERAAVEERAAELRVIDNARLARIRGLQDQPSFDAARWDASFAELVQWVAGAGAPPRRRTEDKKEYKVANWLNIQRTHARNNTLSSAREAKLRTIPGALETKQGRTRPPGDRLAEVAAFQAMHGRTPSSSADDPAEASLWLFLNRAVAGRYGGAQAASVQAAALKLRSVYPMRSTVGDFVARFEGYVAAHGHLPPDSKKLRPPLNKRSLHRALASAATPGPVKVRIRAIVAFPAFQDRAAVCRSRETCGIGERRAS